MAYRDPFDFDIWITDRIHFVVAPPKSASQDVGTFDTWITDRIFYQDYSEAAAVGVTHTKTGTAASICVGSGADVIEYAETGQGVVLLVGIGADVAEFAEIGLGVTIGAGLGADVIENTETGLAVSGLVGAGSDVIEYAETGLGILIGVGSGADVAEFTEAGLGISVSVGSGASSEFIVIRPDGDVSLGSWTDEGDGTTDIWQSIDEVVADDSDYIKSTTTPVNDTYETSMTDVSDPSSSVGHTVSYRYGKNDAGAPATDLTIKLMDGGTEIASWTHTDIGVSAVTVTQTLSAAEADAIGDYSDLRLRFIANEP